MLSEILAHLQAELPKPAWAGVEIAEDIDVLAARAGLVEHGTAIIMPWRERAKPQDLMSGGFRQQVEAQFAVGIVVRQYDQLMGADRAIVFDALKKDIEAALAGHILPGTASPCELIGGEASPVTTGVSIYVQTWATTRFLTGA
ncbi:hypothetical protein C8J27_11072 [Rhodobacter aestuarii]|uniref:Tail terminator n=1 Tax=Rhodobacter aestuarii TaxID=453582 RepID=A0A1N7Q186_9RHOB|nr:MULTISPECIES: hypothetical protein [Rhodobacter]MBZ4022195.1 hypothetical protein [Rhodobacter sp. TJ_12]PTV94021.1 hypothetical protein C8J27_11072 [Rhodobacter aestuarii]SIT16654.1 hypothetical protein SAMN05421580_11272 [Rhodobacter aestuarii]